MRVITGLDIPIQNCWQCQQLVVSRLHQVTGQETQATVTIKGFNR